MKSVRWCGDSHSRIRGFPKAARRRAGHELNRVQHGRDPEDWKAKPVLELAGERYRAALLRGKIEQFSLDALVVAATRAGLNVELRVTRARRTADRLPATT